jgi:hypothetical protein
MLRDMLMLGPILIVGLILDRSTTRHLGLETEAIHTSLIKSLCTESKKACALSPDAPMSRQTIESYGAQQRRWRWAVVGGGS